MKRYPEPDSECKYLPLSPASLTYFPYVSRHVERKPAFLKILTYLPIVESGFMALTPGMGKGFWQNHARYGEGVMVLAMNASVDERDDIIKSTAAATRLLVNYYNYIQKQQKNSVLGTTAAPTISGSEYHQGDQDKGTDYFSMNLNAETALYV
jgi:hypothetical protein